MRTLVFKIRNKLLLTTRLPIYDDQDDDGVADGYDYNDDDVETMLMTLSMPTRTMMTTMTLMIIFIMTRLMTMTMVTKRHLIMSFNIKAKQIL